MFPLLDLEVLDRCLSQLMIGTSSVGENEILKDGSTSHVGDLHGDYCHHESGEGD